MSFRSIAGALAPLAIALAAALAPTAHAQLLGDVSEDELVERLGGGSQAKAWRPTAAPDIVTHVCPEVGSKNLVVVPYAGDGAASVQLNINFATASDELTGIDSERLRRVARALNHPSLARARFAVAGHTDATGNAQRNLELSCARAISARRFLIMQGVSPNRLAAYGFGSERPIEMNRASAVNRRVEIRRAN